MYLYNGVICQSSFPALISKTPGFTALEPFANVLNNICEASFIHNTMDADSWILDVLEFYRRMYNTVEHDFKISIEERAHEIERSIKAATIRPGHTDSQSPINPSTAKTKPNPLDSYNDLESHTPSARPSLDAMKSDRAADAVGSRNSRD